MNSFRRKIVVLWSLMCLFAVASTAFGQNFGDDLFSGFGNDLKGASGESKATLTATLSPVKGGDVSSLQAGDEVMLSLRLDMAADAYTYSQSRSFGGATVIGMTEISGLEPLADSFTADRKPKVQFEDVLGQEVEKFPHEVTWSLRFRLTGAVPVDQVYVAGELKFQVCDASSCTPLTESFDVVIEAGDPLTTPPADEATMTGGSTSTDTPPLEYAYVVTPTRANGSKPDPLTLQFEMQPVDAQPGDTVTVAVTMSLEDGWHTFGLMPHEQQISNPTELMLDEIVNLRPLTEEFEPTHPPETLKQDFDDITEHVHHGTVTWTQKFEVVEQGGYGIAGEIEYQICNTSCMPLKAVPFSLGSLQEPQTIATASPIASSFVTPPKQAEAPAAQPLEAVSEPPRLVASNPLDFEFETKPQSGSLLGYLISAFFGGLILNIMPCVLPVLAIKIMSFVQQAGESRGRVLLLNICYSLGVLGVFLVLATLAVTLKMGWGGLFQKPEFNLAMTAIVFVMGLSMLGVFEIPIPGMVGSAGGQHREGLLGAFMTGIFATLLATPCSGPLMTTTLAWSVKQTAPIVYLVWGVMGLGMASPYLMVGMFPNTIRFLPRPGMWMVRFKEFSGFALLIAAIWLMTSLEQEVLIATLIMLLSLAFALWMIGTLYDHASSNSRKIFVRALAMVVLVIGGTFGWSKYQAGVELADARREAAKELLAGATREVPADVASEPSEDDHELPWQPFSGERLAELLREGKPVLVDFTANWCAICKTNEKLALNTPNTSQFVRKHGIVTLYADYTREDAEIKQWLDKFNSISVPLTVIFPANDPQHPIILDGPFSEASLLSHLEKAVTSDVVIRTSMESGL
ncbi:MAG: thioredoxin family protein [Planctomycetaceae bacterium]|nr:thioredoxin family protein [Planctomycetaceae bacterium]